MNEFLLDTSIKATAVLGAAWLLALLLRRQSAAARYFVWSCAAIAVLLLPLLRISLPRWTVAVSATPAHLATLEPPSPHVAPALEPAPASSVAILYVAGALLVSIRLVMGYARANRWLRRSRPLEDLEWRQLAQDAASRIGWHPIALRLSEETDVPLTCGFWRATIVLPRSAVEWEREQRAVVLLHELVHAKRRDTLMQMLGQAMTILYWFHPLAWFAFGRLRREQECSCDDAVLQTGAGQSGYANNILQLARSARAWNPVPGMARQRDLEWRLRAILDPMRKRGVMTPWIRAAAAIAIAAAVLPLAAIHAQSTMRASLSGSVYDASKAVVPGAAVLLKNLSGPNTEVAKSNAAGIYRFANVPEGRYKLEARANGFAVYENPQVVLTGGANQQFDITLNLGQVSERLEVVGRGTSLVRDEPLQGEPRRIRVGGNVQATRLLSRVPPLYPASTQAAGIEGAVLLRAIISVSGNLIGLSVINTASEELAQAAMDAVRQWRYEPTLLNGVPVEVVTTIEMNFRLER